MKLLIEVTLRKVGGKTCSSDDVFQVVEEHLDGVNLYPMDPDADEESDYEVTSVILKEAK